MSDLIQVPDLIEPIVAYRAWSVGIDERGVRIGSLGGDDEAWDGACHRWVVASCLKIMTASSPVPLPHRAPDEHCSCGFYAIKSIDEATGILAKEILAMVRLLRHHGSPNLPEPATRFRPDLQGAVWGRVELAGKVIEHRFGYRAQRARVLELIPIGLDDHVTRALALRFQIPVADPIDEHSIDQAVEGFAAGIDEPIQVPLRRPLSLVDRLQLLTHQRLFHVIQGGASSESSPTDPR